MSHLKNEISNVCESEALVKDVFIPGKVNFITKIEYSYFMRNEKRIQERITIFFADGGKVEYWIYEEIGGTVCQNTYKELTTCESVGKYWHKNIKDKFNYKTLIKKLQ